jgi:hypothetical protein
VRTKEELPNIPPRDLPGALRNVATTAAINADKVMLLRERPLPRPPDPRSFDEIVKALEALGAIKQITVEATAVELPDAEVIDESEATERTPAARAHDGI